MGSRGSKDVASPAGGRGRGDTLRDKANSLWKRGTISSRPTIAEGEFGGSRLLDRAFFDWTGKPWFKPLDPLFFLVTLSALIVLVFYGLYDIFGRANTFDNSTQGIQRSVATLAVAGAAAFLTQAITYLVAHFLGSKLLVLTCFLIHTMFIAISFYFSLWSSGCIAAFSFIVVWPWLWVKFQSLSIADAHIRVWKEMCGNCCAKGYGFNILSNIILVSVLGFIFMLIWGTVFMGYLIIAHTNYTYENIGGDKGTFNQWILFLLFAMGFWGTETLKNVMYSLMGYVCVIWSKSSEEFAICTSTSIRVWITNFGSNSYAAFVLPVLDPLQHFNYYVLSPFVNKTKDKETKENPVAKCLGCCCYNLHAVFKHFALGVQEMTVYYNYKGLLMTACFGVPFVEGSEMTAYIPKEENPIMPFLAVLVSVAGGAASCFVASYWGDQDSVVWTWRDYLALIGFIEGYFLSSIAMTGIRGAADATDFLRHDDAKSYNRGRETFCQGK